MKTYEIITRDGKSHFVSAHSKKDVLDFWFSPKPKKIIERKDIDFDFNIKIPPIFVI